MRILKLTLLPIFAYSISPECRSNQGPVKDSDTIVNYNFEQLEDLTGLVISMPEVPKSRSASSSNLLFTFQLEAKSNSDRFEGLFIFVNSKTESTNPGKLTLDSTPPDVKKNLRQLKGDFQKNTLPFQFNKLLSLIDQF